MYLVYIAIAFMLILALALFSIPFIKNKSLFTKSFFIPAILTTALAMTLYHYNSNNTALQQWLSYGKEHYNLLVNFNDMGGLNGMITRIKQKLEANPNDAQGWFILGKLYLSQQNYPAAKTAFDKAHSLNPNDDQINFYDKLAASHTE